MKYSFRLIRIGGIDIGIHYTWILVFILISWSLAGSYFPEVYPQWKTATYWIIGIMSSLLLFVSVLLHELAHSFVARARGMAVSNITLFIFGGVSNIEDEPDRPRIEFAISIVGPLASLILAGIFWGLAQLVEDHDNPLFAMLAYLALINLLLAVFNLLPGFPLDGGRVLRSILWGTTGSLTKATRIAAIVGQFFGWALIGIGLFYLFNGYFISGIWLAFIGWFLRSAADASSHEITQREQLRKIRVKDVMDANPKILSPDTKVSGMVNNVSRRQYGRAVPVCQNGQILGIVTIADVKELPQEKWSETSVGEIMTHEPLYRVTPEDDLNTALKLITKHDINQALVLKDGKCVGLISRADILGYFQIVEELSLKQKQHIS